MLNINEMSQITLDFSQNLSKDQIQTWLKSVTPEETDNAIASVLNKPNDKLDYLTTMHLISVVQKDKKYRGNSDFMRIVLGHTTYKESETTGLLAAGYYVKDSIVSDTYTTTQRYKKWDKLLSNLKIKIDKYVKRK